MKPYCRQHEFNNPTIIKAEIVKNTRFLEFLKKLDFRQKFSKADPTCDTVLHIERFSLLEAHPPGGDTSSTKTLMFLTKLPDY